MLSDSKISNVILSPTPLSLRISNKKLVNDLLDMSSYDRFTEKFLPVFLAASNAFLIAIFVKASY